MQASEKQILYLNWLREQITSLPYKKYPDISKEFEDLEFEINQKLKENSLTKDEASDYIESLKNLLEDLKTRIDREYNEPINFLIKCEVCGRETIFYGTLHQLNNYWFCSNCGESKFKIKEMGKHVEI